MKIQIQTQSFRQILGKVQGLTNRKTTFAITENVLIRAENDAIHLRATDLETGFEGRLEAGVEETGTIAVNGRKLFEILKEFPEEAVSVHEEENRWIRIGGASVEYHIVGMDPASFPDLPEIDEIPFYDIEGPPLARMMERAAFVMPAPNEKRAHLIGALVEVTERDGEDHLRMVSTDTSRLTVSDHPFSHRELLPSTPLLLPKKGLNEVVKFLDGDGTLKIGTNEKHFVVKKDNEIMTVRLLEGDFPRYQDVTRPHEGGYSLVFSRPILLGILRRMSILVTDDYKGVVFHFTPNMLEVSTANPEMGDSNEGLRIEYDGPELEIAFNPRFFIESLNSIDQDMVEFHFIESNQACLLRGEGESLYLIVIMPMRI